MKIVDMKYGDVGYVVPWAIESFHGATYINVNHIVYKEHSKLAYLKITKLNLLYFDRNGLTKMSEITELHQYHVAITLDIVLEDNEVEIRDMKVGQTGWVVPWAIYFATNMDRYYINPDYTVHSESKGTVTVKILRLPNHVVAIGNRDQFPERDFSIRENWIPVIMSEGGMLSSLENEFKERDEPKRNKWLVTLKDKSQVTIFADNFQFYQDDAYFRNNTDNKYITDLVGYYRDVQSVVLQ